MMSKYPAFLRMYLHFDSDLMKILLRALLLPSCVQMFQTALSLNSRNILLKKPQDDIYFLLPFGLMAAGALRFMQSSVSSYLYSTLLSVAIVALEVFFRFTKIYRMKKIDRLILNRSEDFIKKKYENRAFKHHLGRQAILKMLIEYSGILSSPAIIIMFQRQNLHFKMIGYDEVNGSYDPYLLAYTLCLNLALEVITDILCWSKTNSRLNLGLCWTQLISDGM
jgi:hypothetical protein